MILILALMVSWRRKKDPDFAPIASLHLSIGNCYLEGGRSSLAGSLAVRFVTSSQLQSRPSINSATYTLSNATNITKVQNDKRKRSELAAIIVNRKNFCSLQRA